MLSALSILFASSVPVVDGHGFMVTPKIRGIFKPPGLYEPQSVGAAGPGQKITICGKNADNHQKGDEVAKMPTPGSKYTIQAKITAHHLGHMIVRVCPFIDGNTQYKDLKKCIRLASTAGEKTWPLSANTGVKEWTVVLPSKNELEALNSPNGVFTVQWRYNTANSCKNPVDTLEDSSNCNEGKCCSEVFVNCADVVFDGIKSSPPDPPVDPRPRPIPSPGPRPSTGGGSGADVCVAKAGWTGQQAMDDWCASTMVCGGDGGASCDCSCSGGGEGKPEPEPEPEGEFEHKIKPGAKAATIFKGLDAFCNANKGYYCDTTHTQAVAAELCECKAVKPTPAPAPVPTPDPEPEPEPEDDGDVKEDGLDFNTCKGKCQKLCNGQHEGVATNQGWGTPRYIHCKCSDGHEQKFKGCECKNPGCPKSMKLVEVSSHSTKFAGGVQKQVEIAALGETLDLD